MKKLGLRAVAGGLALLLTASAFAPAATANAADMLVTAKAPKTLVITADMIDDDGEIVISGEKWDRIVVEKEAAAKDIYFDGVEVGELVVESGNTAKVQLWDVAAEALTVKEPELVELDMTEIRKLLSDKETRDQALELYMKVQADNKKALKQIPSVVTMADAEVDNVTVSGSVKLNFKEGEVKAFNLEASAKVSQANVTLEGYNGEVTYKGGEKFNVVNFKTVGCNLEKLTVDSAASNNYLNVSSEGSSVATVAVEGNAAVSLNIPTGELKIADTATAAQVGVLNKVDALDVSANNAKVSIAAAGSVKEANVTGNKVNIGGAGKLDKAEISGKDAYVSTNGTTVEGDNTYIPPKYVEPPRPSLNLPELPENSKVILPSETGMGGYGHDKTVTEDGAVEVSYTGIHQEIQFSLPGEYDTSIYDKLIVTLKTGDATEDSKVNIKVVDTEAPLNEWNNPTQFTDVNAIASPVENIEIDLSAFPDKKVNKIFVMAATGASDVTIYRFAFVLKEGVTPPAEDEGPAAPKEWNLPEGSKEYNFADLKAGGYGYTATPANHNGVKIAYEGQFQEVQYALPEGLLLSDYEKILLTVSSVTGSLCIKLKDETGADIGFFWAKGSMGTKDIELKFTQTGYGSNEALDAAALAKKVSQICLMECNDAATEAVVYRLAFVPKTEGGNESGGTGDDTQGGTGDDTQGGTGDNTQGGTGDNTQGGTGDDTQGGTEDDTEEVTFEITADTTILTVGDTVQITAGAVSTGVITWKSNKTDIATVSNNGLVKAVSAGDVTITATYSGKTASIDFEVVAPEYKYVKITANTKEMYLGDEPLKYSATTNDGEGTITWKSLDETIATVDANGNVTAKKAGKVGIMASCEGYESATVLVTVNANSVVLTETPIVLTEGDVFELAGLVTSNTQTVEWSIEGDAAKIENGTIVALEAGTATLKATCREASATVTVTVKAALKPNVVLVPINPEAVTVTTNEDGTVKVDCVGSFKGVKYNVPESKAAKAGEVTTAILNITAHNQFVLKAFDTNGTEFFVDYPGYGLDQNDEPTTANYYVNIDPTQNVIAAFEILCMEAETTTFTVNSITFVSEAPAEKLDTIEFNVDDAEKELVTVTNNDNGSVTITATEQWKGAALTLPAEVVGDGKVISVTGNFTVDKQFGWQVYNVDWSTQLNAGYPGWDITVETTKDFTLSVDPIGDGISAIRVQTQAADQVITVNSVTISKALWVEQNW